ncbi:MAG: CAP domain-containing protein [Anaerostipes sp.]|jgi:hypothetical protein
MKIWKQGMSILFLVMFILLGAKQVSAQELTAKITTSGEQDYTKANSLLNELNRRRVNQGEQKLQLDQELQKAAMQRAAELSFVYGDWRPDDSFCTSISKKVTRELYLQSNQGSGAVLNEWQETDMNLNDSQEENYISVGVGCYHVENSYFWVVCFGEEAATGNPRTTGGVLKVKPIINTTDSNLQMWAEEVESNTDKGTGKIRAIIWPYNSIDDNYRGTPIEISDVGFSSNNTSFLTINSIGQYKIKSGKSGKATIKVYLKKLPSVYSIMEIEEEILDETPKKGQIYTVSGIRYKVIDKRTNGKGKVSIVGVSKKKKKAKSITINSKVRIKGYQYKISEIAPKAFQNCKKLNKIKIKSKYLIKIGKKAFYKIKTKAVFYVPKNKRTKYKKLLKKSTGFKSTMRIRW